MNRNLGLAAFAAGCLVLAWVGAGYVGSNPLALAMTALIAAVYGFGALELRRFDRETAALASAVAAVPPAPSRLEDWLATLPGALRDPVRQRIDGTPVPLPGPALTPYLVGLLVMLGMLGTFLGLAFTLNGAVFALERSADLQAMRAALSAPVKGLGLAFGTSVGGVAASAMLGLMSALCRHGRRQAAQSLDACVASTLHEFSLTRERREAYRAMQAQAAAMPAVIDALQALATRMDVRDERLLSSHESLHREVSGAHAALAASVEASIRTSLGESARLAGDTLQPAVEAMLAGVARETTSLHARLTANVGEQLDGMSARFDDGVAAATAAWRATAAEQAREVEASRLALSRALDAAVARFGQGTADLLAATTSTQAALREEMAVRDGERAEAMSLALEKMATTLGDEWRAVSARSLDDQARLSATLASTVRELAADARTQSRETIDEAARLMRTAAEAPHVAAEVIGSLREQLSEGIVRDNAQLAERERLMASLSALLSGMEGAATAQRAAVDAWLSASAATLDGLGERLAGRIDTETARLGETAAAMGDDTAEVASLGEALAGGLRVFGEANARLVDGLGRIEEALDRSLSRSDEQLAYYVTQARELIDLSVMSQQRIVDELRQRGAARPALDGVGA